ncbi:ferritin-like domain-containing protein [Sphingomonas sp. NBWT7]|uniref:ferritin-like domain-containing protein n=1 Tax=Sphingomonas sp. NBWT7 TaxID=2596913 RepID=UPI0021565E8A|nr:ferritin-like domain-containing protein [Sphingomonas sp. NBWT7]
MTIALPSVATVARAVLETAEPAAKIKAARRAARAWRQGDLAHRFDTEMPAAPARPDRPELLLPGRMPRRGKAGSERGRIALLHALAHIEFTAIDLAFDLVGRFGAQFSRSFVDDWISVGADEAIHFALLDRRLRALGSGYGALPAHAGLWEAADATTDDVVARLAVVPMALEARGLDVTPVTVERFVAAGDVASARILQRIYHDEIRHVGYGTKWFGIACETNGFVPVTHWRAIILARFRGIVKAPFNGSARDSAGLTREFYADLA